MIDFLTLRIKIHYKHYFNRYSGYYPRKSLTYRDLGVTEEMTISRYGELIRHRHPFESIPSSFSGMAFKIYDKRNYAEPDFYIEIKGSPAKLMQGHNVYGTDNIYLCVEYMIGLLELHYPELCSYLDLQEIELSEIDLTYFSRAGSQDEVQHFINALAKISKGQTKARTSYAGQTAYFGKTNSRYKNLKVYAKFDELKTYKKRLLSEAKKNNPTSFSELQVLDVLNDDLFKFCEGMIRFEARLKTRWLMKRKIPRSYYLLSSFYCLVPYLCWQESFSDIFKAIQGEEFTVRDVSDQEIENKLKEKFFTVSAKTGKITYTKASTAYRVYRSIKIEGYEEVKRTTPHMTFYRSLSMFEQIGLSRAQLQQITAEKTAQVIPLVKYITVTFGNQFPENFDDKKHYEELVQRQRNLITQKQRLAGES
jgi:II/X family phage/plasmid replication protein